MSPSLYIMRHGRAEAGMGMPDDQRALTEEGLEQLGAVAAGLVAEETAFDLVLCSPFRRTLQTAETVIAAMNLNIEPVPVEALASGASSPERCIEAIAEQIALADSPGSILAVGHLPEVSYIVGCLCSGLGCRAVDFSPATIVRLSCHGAPRPGNGSIVWALRPAMLAALAGRP